MKYSILYKFLFLLLFFSVAVIPIYLFPSGGFQPSHIILLMFSLMVIYKFGFLLNTHTLTLLLLTVWIFFSEAVRTLTSFGVHFNFDNAIFFSYNLLIVSTIIFYVKNKGLLPIILGLFVACFFVSIFIIFSGVNFKEVEGGRSTGTFNNPNQLGFFSVCVLSFAYFFYAAKNINYLMAVMLFVFAIFLSIVSLSKAAMIANLIVIFVAIIPKLKIGRLFAFISIFIIACAIYFVVFESNYLINDFLFYNRLLNMFDEDDSSFASRGYFVFLNGDVFALFMGLSSSAIDASLGHEVHSTFGSVANNYGLIGLAFIFLFFYYWSKVIYNAFGVQGFISIIMPSVLYGVTHNGTRFTIFWILVAATIGYIKGNNVAKSVV